MSSSREQEFLNRWSQNLPAPLFSTVVGLSPSTIHGQGLHALEDIALGEILIIDQGIKVDHSIAFLLYDEIEHQNDLPIDWDTSLVDRPIQNGAYANHSCSPNIGLANEKTFVSISKIKKGEELVIDYATFLADDEWTLTCNCGNAECRKNITGRDHEDPLLRERLGRWFSPYLKRHWSIK